MTDPAPTEPSPDPSAEVSAEPRRAHRRRLPRVLIVLATVVVLLAAGGAVYAYTVQRSITKNINHGLTLPTEEPSSDASGTPEPTPGPAITGTLNYVLLGSDKKDPDAEYSRSDSIMVVHLNKKRDHAYIVSFPRDMYVAIPGYGKNKINTAYRNGGPALTVRTLQNLTGVKMDHIVLVDFEGFVNLTEDLGGVTVTNKTEFDSHGYHYSKGKITIKGKEALWFVRERHSLPGGDLDRAENQRNVIKAVVTKGLSAGVLTDPAKFTTFIGNVARHLTVDDSLTDAEIRKTAFSLRLTGKNVELLQAPLAGFGNVSPIGSVDLVDPAKMAQLGSALKNDKMAAYVKNNP